MSSRGRGKGAKMAKSLRSKSQRKNRAALREKVYDPAVAARVNRLVAKSAEANDKMIVENVADEFRVEKVEKPSLIEEAKQQSKAMTKGSIRKSRRAKGILPNPYGISRREMSF